MGEDIPVTCPWCHEALEVWVEIDDLGSRVEDCPVCCRPWLVQVWRGPDGRPTATIDRS